MAWAADVDALVYCSQSGLGKDTLHNQASRNTGSEDALRRGGGGGRGEGGFSDSPLPACH